MEEDRDLKLCKNHAFHIVYNGNGASSFRTNNQDWDLEVTLSDDEDEFDDDDLEEEDEI